MSNDTWTRDHGRIAYGQTLRDMCRIVGKHAWIFITIFALCQLPAVIDWTFEPPEALSGETPLTVLSVATSLLGFLLSILGSTYLTIIGVRHLLHLPVTFHETSRFFRRRIGDVVLKSILFGLLVLIGVLALCILAIAAYPLFHSSFATFVMAVAIAVPVVIFGIAVSPFPVVVLVEGDGVMDSIERSMALTKRHRWKVFGLFALLSLPEAGGGVIIDRIVGPASTAAGFSLTTALSILSACFYTALLCALYVHLRAARNETIDQMEVTAPAP